MVTRKALAAPLTATVKMTADRVATLQADAEELATITAGAMATTPEEYALIDSVLTEAVRKRDAALAMRREATVPLYGVIKTVEGWFRPVDQALAKIITDLKRALGDYRLAQAERERAARELAAHAADTGDADTMIEALTTAAAEAEAPAGGARTRFVWTVKRIAADMLAPEWLCPDVAKIEAVAKAHKGDDAPIIPGVTFERVALVGAKHK